MVYELLVALGAAIPPAIATNLFTAIHMDTGSFRYSNVTPTTFRIGGALVAAGADPAFVSGQLYERRSLEALRWLGQALTRIEVSPDGRVAWLALPAGGGPEGIIEAGDLVTYSRSVGSVGVGCLVRGRKGVGKGVRRGKGGVVGRRYGLWVG